MKMPPDFPSNAQDWEMTPLAMRTLVVLLWQENRALKRHLYHLQGQVGKLGEQVNKNSQNSSKPPSSDITGKNNCPKKESSGKLKGGQAVYKGTGRRLKPLEQVKKVVVIRLIACAECGALFLVDDLHPQRHQVSELPRIEPNIVEYQRHTLTCLVCGGNNQPEWSEAMPKGRYGKQTQALIAYLDGRIGMSQRDMEEALATVFHVEIGLGSILAQEQIGSQALKEPFEKAEEYAREQKVIIADETSCHELAKLCWMWVCVTSSVTFSRIFKGRGSKKAKEFLGENFTGILGSDRYKPYNWVDLSQRQICWAHLKHDFQALVERCCKPVIIGRRLLEQLKMFFVLWHRFKDGLLPWSDFHSAMQAIRHDVCCLLTIGTFVNYAQTWKTCQNIIQLKQALWTFVNKEEVEPTNNDTERSLKRSVIWRRRSFGTQSEKGSCFVERILTTVAALHQQKRDILDYIVEAYREYRLGCSTPALLTVC